MSVCSVLLHVPTQNSADSVWRAPHNDVEIDANQWCSHRYSPSSLCLDVVSFECIDAETHLVSRWAILPNTTIESRSLSAAFLHFEFVEATRRIPVIVKWVRISEYFHPYSNGYCTDSSQYSASHMTASLINDCEGSSCHLICCTYDLFQRYFCLKQLFVCSEQCFNEFRSTKCRHSHPDGLIIR